MPPSRDIEMKHMLPIKEDSSVGTGNGNHTYMMREPDYEGDGRGGGGGGAQARLDRWVNSFRRDPNSRITPYYEDHADGDDVLDGDEEDGIQRMDMAAPRGRRRGTPYYDMRMAAIQTAQSGLARKLKGRHLQMIAIGGSIGTGLFVASGRALELGGPASILIAYSFIGAGLYFTVQALGELSVAFPVAGSFSAYSTRFLHPSWGFAMGWNYAMQWLVVLPLEIISASITITYWKPDMNKAVFVAIFLLTIITINLFGVKGYGEAEFFFAIIKVISVIGFILLAIVLNIGGTPGSGYIGAHYWRDPGAFHNGFKGLCSVFVNAAFAFAGTELVGLAAAETLNPRKSLPTAIKQVFWRITLFYVVALFLVGLLVPYDDPRLLDGTSASASASPFVIAIENARIDILPSVMNVIILVAVLSVGNSAVFGSTRTLAALADQNQAPKVLSYIDRRGRPLVAVAVASAVGLLAFLADLSVQAAILDWLLALSGLSSIFTWGSICVAHIRFRKAWAAQGHGLHELAFVSQSGVWGSWLGLLFNVLVLAGTFWVGAWPVGFEDDSPAELASSFFHQYLAAPIVIIFFLAHHLYYKTSVVKIRDIDIDTGRRDFDLPILLAQEAAEKKAWPRWKKIYKLLC